MQDKLKDSNKENKDVEEMPNSAEKKENEMLLGGRKTTPKQKEKKAKKEEESDRESDEEEERRQEKCFFFPLPAGLQHRLERISCEKDVFCFTLTCSRELVWQSS